ncbi:hypothetical protein HF086_005566 [Spodoptera exigua]|uniref:RNase III domain-containing protein n=1 Tax=Spodoptera exigua TaxID=7107 RepID=A0A922MS63_SPOEX|nr:hypothetical protein HF086_005566 [Spodoptera exigua]
MFSHYKLAKLPTCKVIRFNIEYTILYVEEPPPQNFTVKELDLFEEFLFYELLELVDLDLGKGTDTTCSQFHFMPRFVRYLPEGGCEVLSMCEVLKYLIDESGLLIAPDTLEDVHRMDHYTWQKFVDRIKGMIVTYPGKKPCSVRVDQIDRSPPTSSDEPGSSDKPYYPEIVHFGIRPPQLSYAGNPEHLIANMAKPSFKERQKLAAKEAKLQEMRTQSIVTLINIMSRFGKHSETESDIKHNERLEFLGDAVVEFLSSIHLFRMFPGLAEGGLATYRASIVQNQHLAQLAKVADRVFALALWHNQPDLLDVWTKERAHPLQEQEPLGDRKYIKDFEFLQRLVNFENSIGVQFKHIRLLARAFTDRSVGFTHLTLGSNQRLEFLGDTVLQLVVSDRLYRHFPDHHEGHLSSMVCDDLDMSSYAIYNNPKAKPTTKKHKADLLEAFLGALYIDKNLEYCQAFCNACLFPRLQEFIMNQDWNDPKSKLQQCCLTLRSMEGGEPDIPVYK